MIDRADIQIVLQFFERLFHFREHDGLLATLFRVSDRQIRAQHRGSFSQPDFAQLLEIKTEAAPRN